MGLEVDLNRNEVEEYSVWDIIVIDRLYIVILLVLLRNKSFDHLHALPTPDIYRTIRMEFDKKVRYQQIWKRLYRLLEYGIVERVGENPVRWYIRCECVDKVAELLSKVKIRESTNVEVM